MIRVNEIDNGTKSFNLRDKEGNAARYDIIVDCAADYNNRTFVLCDENGEETTYTKIATYDFSKTGKSYILYTDGIVDEEGRTEVYVSIYDSDSKPMRLLHVETEEEYDVADEVLKKLPEVVKKKSESKPALEQYIEEINQIPDVTIEEENQLIAKAKAGDETAKKVLIEANLKRVLEMSEEYKDCVIDYYDLINEGNNALVSAIDLFEPSGRNSFGDHITIRIRQAICRLVSSMDPSITIPPDKVPEINRIISAARKQLKQTGREPTVEEIAQEADMSVDEARELWEECMRACGSDR